MAKYLGTKQVSAAPMHASVATQHGYKVGDHEGKMGYEVTYEDGYKSWSPEEVFSKSYKRDGSLTFGDAIHLLKQGHKVSHSGWNGKSMYLWLKPGIEIPSEWCKDPMLKEIAYKNGGRIEALGTICMKTADNKVLTGWLAGQTDILSEDWCIVE